MRWKPRGWMLVNVLLLALSTTIAMAQGTTASPIITTRIADTVYRADGTAATGTVIVSWGAFTTASGQAVPSGSSAAAIAAGGALTLQLASNAGASPMGSYYTAVYHLDDGSVSREYWVIPVSAGTVALNAVKSTVLPTSVAMQTVSKAYVDTAIIAAITGHPLDSATPYVLKEGDTMLGPLALAADPTTSAQAANKHYVDVSISGLTSGLAQKVSLLPAATQVVSQPAGTQMQVNQLNGVKYATQYVTGEGNNGIANAAASADCAAGCAIQADRSYLSGEKAAPQTWNSGLTSGTHLIDTRGGTQRDTFLNPFDNTVGGNNAGQTIDVTSTRSTPSVAQQTTSEIIGSFGLVINHQGLAGGSNLFPRTLETVPYFKTGYSGLMVTGTYNTQGQHVLSPNAINCYGVGDCLIGSQFLTASGGFRDEADEATHPMDIQVQEDPLVFQGTCAAGCSPGSTQVMLTPTSAPGTQGEGRYLIDINPAGVLTAGSLIGGAVGTPSASATFSGTAFPLSTFLSTAALISSQLHDIAPGTVSVAIATSGVPSGFVTNTGSLSASTGIACIADQPNGFVPHNYEMANYTVIDATHVRMTLNKVHAARATIAVGGLCGYGLEQTVDTARGIRQIFPVIGSYSATGLYYAGGATPIVGLSGQTSAFLNVSGSIASIARSGNVVTVTTAGNFANDVNGLTMTVAGVADSSYNGSFAVTSTAANKLTYNEVGANSTSTGGTVAALTGGYVLYPMAEVLTVYNATAKKVDGQMTLAPNTVAWASNDVIEQPHYYQENMSGDTQFIGQTTPRPSNFTRAGMQYQLNVGPGMRGWSVANAVPASNYLGNGGTHSIPDVAYEATGIWRRTFDMQAGDESVFSVHCGSHGCGKWNSNYDLFQLDSSVGVDTIGYRPQTSTWSLNLRGTTYGFTPLAFTAGAINATTISTATVNTATVNATTINATTINGALSATALPVFGAAGASHAQGAVPDPGATAGATRYLREDGSWNTPAGSGAAAVRSGFVTNGLLASYPLTDGVGTAPADESGNGYTAAFCPTTQAPAWTAQGLNFTAASNNCFALPSAIPYTTVRTVEFTYTTLAPYAGSGNASSAQYPCWVCSSIYDGFETLSQQPNGAVPMTGTSKVGTSGTGTHTAVVIVNGVADQWFIDGHPSAMSGGNSLSTILDVARNVQWMVGSGSTNSFAFQGSIYYVRLLDRALTAAEATQDSSAMQAAVSLRGVKFGAQTTPNDANVWIAHGDSRTAGQGSGVPYSTYLNTYTDATYQVQTNGVPGASAITLARYTLSADCFQSSPSSPLQIASIWEGTNDAGGVTSNAGIFQWVMNDVRNFHSCGFTTIVANDPSRITRDAAEQSYNTSWRGLWPTYADGFVDLGADPLIGGTNAYANTTYYDSDGVHMTVAGYTLIAQKFAREANYLKGSTLQNCMKTVTATYTLVDGDGCTKLNAAGGSFATTLYDANDFTGRTVYLQNAAVSGANVVTIAAASGQTIDGAASITIPNGVMRVLQIVYNGTPGGGNSWHVLQ